MDRIDYQWHLTFSVGEAFGEITIPEKHPEFEILKSTADITAATLVDMNKYSILEDSWKQLDAFVHHITFPEGARLKQIFRRFEVAVLGGKSRTVPVIAIEVNGEKSYYFAYRDTVVKSFTSRYYREEW